MEVTTARTAFAAVLGALFFLIGPLTARAAGSDLDATFSRDNGKVTARGQLSSDGAPLPGEPLLLFLDGDEVASGNTGNGGTYALSLRIPDQLDPGTHRVELHFAGNETAEPARADYQFEVEAEPEPERQPRVLRLRAEAPKAATNGEVITLAGSLRTEDGKAVARAGIALYDDGGEAEESYTLTNSNGHFETFYAIPEAQPDGALILRLAFRGTDALAAASTNVRIEIEFTDVAPEPTDPAEEVSPSPSPESEEPSPSAPAPSPSPSAAPIEAPGANDGSLGWYLLALGAVGTLVVGAAAAVIVRARIRERPVIDDDSAGPGVFDDEPEAQIGRHGLPPEA